MNPFLYACCQCYLRVELLYALKYGTKLGPDQHCKADEVKPFAASVICLVRLWPSYDGGLGLVSARLLSQPVDEMTTPLRPATLHMQVL